MSAESPRRLARKKSAGQIVLPQPVSDPSLIDSVAGFIQEVVPQAYSSSSGDSREVITWVRMQQADINDPVFYPDTGEQDGVPPLLLVLGYGSGVQVWLVPASGEAREVLSWSQGSVRTLCVLPSPEPQQDLYKHKRPLVAMVDNAGPGPQFCSVSFISLRDGDQVKSIKFSHQVWDVVANCRSVVVTLAERIAIFDASSLEDKLVVTTCYPSPDVNPVALGTRWLAYADRRLVSQWRSLGGCHSEGPQSVTATVFHAAKFLGKGLRDLSESVASSLTGGSPEISHSHLAEPCHKGIITILDIETKLPKETNEDQVGTNRILAHFNAHLEPIVALSFDPSGMLLVTADKRGHRFHVFRINTHPCTPTLAYVQHLYVLHRGDTTARIQDIAFSADSRWVAISSMRGTTHVFPITPYGGPVGVRTHTTPHVVNKLSRFHRSAGLSDEGRNSPLLWEGPSVTHPPSHSAPFGPPTSVTALAQVRRQSTLTPPTEESIMRVAASFGAPRALPLAPHIAGRSRRAVDSLFVMACNGYLIQYDLEPKHISGVSKEKVCDDTSVELHVEPRAEWLLQRPPYFNALHPPLPCTNPLLSQADPPAPVDNQNDDEHWLSQVEIVTHAGPHRRLWMGPQFTFITFSTNNEPGDVLDINKQVVRSSPVNMPLKQPLIIESGSCSSLELSPNLVELVYKTDCSWSCRLREDLAEAMLESPSNRNTGVKGVVRREPVIERQVNPLGSVVTLTAQLSFPTDLLTDDGQISIVGTETKRITLESRLNNLVTKPLLRNGFQDDTLTHCSQTQPKITDAGASCSLDLGKNSCNKSKKNCNLYENVKKVLSEINENVSSSQVKADDIEVLLDTQEKKGKNSKPRRKSSKSERNKHKTDLDFKAEDDVTLFSNDIAEIYSNVPHNKSDMPVYNSILQSSGNIEIQLKEALLEKDIEHVPPIELEDCKSRKRSLDRIVEMKPNVVEELSPKKTNNFCNDKVKENDQESSRQRKKSKMNVQAYEVDTFSGNKSNETKTDTNDIEPLNSSVKIIKSEEKSKGKRKKSKKSAGQNELINDDTLFCTDSSVGDKKKDESNTDGLLVDISQELYSEVSEDDLDLKASYVVKTKEKINEYNKNVVSDTSNEQPLNTETEVIDLNISEEKVCTTDDELNGFESDLLVKDTNCSPEKSSENDVFIIMDDKDSDKETDKIKNEETTDKDSSDECQSVVVKSDFKHSQKKGKMKKIMRKNREMEYKVYESETKHEEIIGKENLVEAELITKEETNIRESILTDEKVEVILKIDSEEDKEDLCLESKNNKITKSVDACFPELKMSVDGIKRRIRRKDLLEKDKKIKDIPLQEISVPKRTWSSVVSFSSEDPNGNTSKSGESVTPIRSWSSIAAAPAKPKCQDTEFVKTNSVEDRDSVYESCNDSVSEEAEPALDSLGSCYFEPETKEDIKDCSVVLEYQKDGTSSGSKSGSSAEEKSNTDSGEKDDLIVGVQVSTTKSKKQKKKKR